ncbi:hypothetical protein Tco_1204118 [Tanacetum coccineum]
MGRDLDNSTSNVLIPLDSWISGILVYKLPLSAEYGVSTSIGYGVSSSLSNTAYSLKLINTTYLLPLDTAYGSSDKTRGDDEVELTDEESFDDEDDVAKDYEWYNALEDSELKDEALRNKAIMEGFIKDDDDKSRYEQKRRWNTYTNYDDAYEINHEHNKSEELCEVQELQVCNIRRYMMIKYSFNDDEEYVAVKEDEYDNLTVTRKEAC